MIDLTPIMKSYWKLVEKADNKRIASQSPTPGIEQVLDISYAGDTQKAHLLDIYYPETAEGKLPVIIDIHGGGWMYGYKEINKYFCLKLAEQGFCVASINYRLCDKVFWYDQVKDVFTAFSFLAQELKKYPADLNNVFIVGDSAGGQLVSISAALCADENLRKDFGIEKPDFDISAVGAICPAVNLSTANKIFPLMIVPLLGSKFKESKYYKYMDFSNIASHSLPPFYIVTASGDFVRKQAYELKSILDKVGVENKFHDFDELLDGKKLQHVFSVTNPYSQPGQTANCEMTQFFKSKIKEIVK